MVFGLLKSKPEPAKSQALSGASNTHQANLGAVGAEAPTTTTTTPVNPTTNVNMAGLHQAQAPRPVFHGDPDNQVIVFDSKVCNWNYREIQLEGLPAGTIIK